MNRREILNSFIFGTISLSGCINMVKPQEENGGSNPSTVVDWDFETGIQTEASLGENPLIIANRENNMIIVEGEAYYGSSNCGYIEAAPPKYNKETATLSVVVEDKIDEEKAGEEGCGDDAASETYRVSVEFDEGVPDRVKAEHPWEYKTVNEFG